MTKPTTIQPHLELHELETRYRKAGDLVERNQWQIIWLLAQNRKVAEVAEITGYKQGWIRELARRFNRFGPTALGDKRHQASGGPPLLDGVLQAELAEAVQQPHPDGGLWSGPKVTKWIEQKTGRKVRRQRGWEYLTKLGFTLQAPRPHHAKADAAAQAEFKKNCQSK
jgi:transposase